MPRDKNVITSGSKGLINGKPGPAKSTTVSEAKSQQKKKVKKTVGLQGIFGRPKKPQRIPTQSLAFKTKIHPKSGKHYTFTSKVRNKKQCARMRTGKNATKVNLPHTTVVASMRYELDQNFGSNGMRISKDAHYLMHELVESFFDDVVMEQYRKIDMLSPPSQRNNTVTATTFNRAVLTNDQRLSHDLVKNYREGLVYRKAKTENGKWRNVDLAMIDMRGNTAEKKRAYHVFKPKKA